MDIRKNIPKKMKFVASSTENQNQESKNLRERP